MARNVGADPTDPHESPANPDNRISVSRRAADAENAQQIIENAPETLTGVKPGARPTSRMSQRRRVGKNVVEVQSTGHSWDGIEEYDNPLPRWWLWTFYATIVWSVGYVLAYPAIPLIHGSTQGFIGTTPRDEVAVDIKRFADANAPIQQKLASVELGTIKDDPELVNYTANAGRAVFNTWCVQCHQAGGAGASGYPALVDDDWLWGGTIDDIHTTILHGIRSPDDPDSRYSEMPRFGADGILDAAQIDQVTNYVLALAKLPHDTAKAEAGATVYADNCVACHMEDGTGDRAQGAPNLTDAVWLYSEQGRPTEARIRQIIHDGPFGVMPAWSQRLSEADIRAVASYVHSLGGGE
nr:cytochrome-c oxidase, cbb3-type subunit III [Paracoccus sphaerophysae]